MATSSLGLNLHTLHESLPYLTSLLGALGVIHGFVSFQNPALGAKSFGIDVGDQLTPKDVAYTRVHGVRNIKDGALNIALSSYLVFSSACRSSPLAADVVRRCIGMTLLIRSTVGVVDGWTIGQYMKSEGNKEKADQNPEDISKITMPVKFAVFVASLGLAHLLL